MIVLKMLREHPRVRIVQQKMAAYENGEIRAYYPDFPHDSRKGKPVYIAEFPVLYLPDFQNYRPTPDLPMTPSEFGFVGIFRPKWENDEAIIQDNRTMEGKVSPYYVFRRESVMHEYIYRLCVVDRLIENRWERYEPVALLHPLKEVMIEALGHEGYCLGWVKKPGLGVR